LGEGYRRGFSVTESDEAASEPEMGLSLLQHERALLRRGGRSAEGRHRLMGGDYFGEIGLLERIPRTATVQPTEDSIVYRISGDTFLNAAEQPPVISGVLLGGVMRGLARAHPSYRPTTPPTTESTGA